MARPRKQPAGAQPSLLTADAAPLPELPVAEQPYPLPTGWKWVRLGDCNCYAGKNINPDSFPEKMFELYSVPSSMADYPEILSGNEIGSAKQAVEPDDVLLCKINPRINRVWRVAGHTTHILVASSEWIVFRNKNISSKYMMYCMKSQYFRNYMLSNVSGVGGSLMRAQPKHVRCYPIPLPPREEQERIVARIESLFAKLDEAREKVDAVVEGSETRKAALLHKAFSGELTATWRVEKGVSADWEKKLLADIGNIITGSTPSTKQPDYYGTAIAFVKPADLNAGRFVSHTAEYLSEKGKAVSRPVKAGSTCVCCIGTIGKCGFLLCDAVTNQQINSICPHDFMNELFVYYYCSSNLFKHKLIENSSATTLPIINKSRMSSLTIPVPPLPEQEEIVRLLDSLLERERQIREAAEQVRERIDLMKKAILARAFRGELG